MYDSIQQVSVDEELARIVGSLCMHDTTTSAILCSIRNWFLIEEPWFNDSDPYINIMMQITGVSAPPPPPLSHGRIVTNCDIR